MPEPDHPIRPDHHEPARDRHPVTILVNRRDVHLPHHEVTGKQIKHAAAVPETFKLFGPHGKEVGNDELVRIHDRERFTAISGQDVS
jgi:multiubiquitin